MKLFKKICVFVLLGTLVFALAACGNSSKTKTETEKITVVENEESEEEREERVEKAEEYAEKVNNEDNETTASETK